MSTIKIRKQTQNSTRLSTDFKSQPPIRWIAGHSSDGALTRLLHLSFGRHCDANGTDGVFEAGRKEEALQWCDRILEQYAGNRQVTGVIERRKKEITDVLETKKEGVIAQDSAKYPN